MILRVYRFYAVMAAMLICIAACPDATSSDQPQSLRFDGRGRPLISGQLGEHQLVFRLDTAAERSVIYQSAAFLLEFPAVPRASQRVYTATGYKSFPLFDLPPLTALGLTRTMGPTVALPDPADGAAVGIIGVDFLAGRTLWMDKAAATLKLLPSDTSLSDQGLIRWHGFAVSRGSAAITVRLGQLDVPAIIDTGAERSVLNRALVAEIRRLTPEDAPVMAPPSARVSIQAAGGSVRADVARVKRLEMGDMRFENLDVIVADLPIFTLLGARRAPAMILGMDLLNRQSFAVDFGRFEIWLPGPGARPGNSPQDDGGS